MAHGLYCNLVSVDHREQMALGPHKLSLGLAKISLAFHFCAEYYE
jgi:hypothetical protein